MSDKANDYAAFAADAPSAEGLTDLSKTATSLLEAEQEVTRLEGELKAAQKKVQDISENVLPALFEANNLSELKLANGTKLKVEPVLTLGSVTKKPEVLKWLEESGNGGLIKRTLTVALGKDADEREAALIEELASEGFSDVSPLRWVEAQTLKAHVKKELEAGRSVDMDLLGAREFKRAKITGLPKDGSSAFGE